jgi:hypothetical protein
VLVGIEGRGAEATETHAFEGTGVGWSFGGGEGSGCIRHPACPTGDWLQPSPPKTSTQLTWPLMQSPIRLWEGQESQ